MELSIEDKFKHLIADHLKLEDLSLVRDESTIDSLGGDSLDRTEIIMNIEEEYDLQVNLPIDLYDPGVTIRSIWNNLQGYLVGQHSLN
jgi:acyl carrier protein